MVWYGRKCDKINFTDICENVKDTVIVHIEDNKLLIEVKKLKDEVANLQIKVSLKGKILDSIKTQSVHDNTIIPETYESENILLNPDKVSPNNDVTFETLIRENSWFFCEYCNYKTKKEKGLTIHIGKLHGAEKEVNDESCMCDTCNNVSTSESMLKVHNTSFHSWKCHYCIMINVNNREKHMR